MINIVMSETARNTKVSDFEIHGLRFKLLPDIMNWKYRDLSSQPWVLSGLKAHLFQIGSIASIEMSL